MKLDRNTNTDKRGKYALIKLRKLNDNGQLAPPAVFQALETLREFGILDYGDTPDTDFFVIRLRDANASAALDAYARSEMISGDWEFASEVFRLADKAHTHPNKKRPD